MGVWHGRLLPLPLHLQLAKMITDALIAVHPHVSERLGWRHLNCELLRVEFGCAQLLFQLSDSCLVRGIVLSHPFFQHGERAVLLLRACW